MRERDVIFAFFGTIWSGAMQRGMVMPEDRLAEVLLGNQDVRRLLVCSPYRSLASKALALAHIRPEAPFPAVPGRALYEPLRLRRGDPVRAARSIAAYERGMRRAAERMGLERPAIITCHPLLAGGGRFEWAESVTYYAWDDWTASEPHRRHWPAYEAAFEQIRASGRRVCAVSEEALKSIAPTGPHAVIPNGVDPGEWEPMAPAPDWLLQQPSPRFLYVGSLGARVDVEQARAVAHAYPQGSLTFAGFWGDSDHFASLRELPNVSFVLDRPRTEITGAIGAADACLIPHVRNRLTQAMSPLKLFEYLAGGAPVAAVDLPPIKAVHEHRVALAPTGGDFVPAVAKALELGRAPANERLTFLRRHAWRDRVDRILELALAPSA